MRIRKDGREIEASPKAFRLFYKEQGYEEAGSSQREETNRPEETGSPEEPKDAKDISGLKVSELKALAEKMGIEGCADMKKSELLELLADLEEG